MENLSTSVGIITYDHSHLKTEQILHRLSLRAQFSHGPGVDIKLLALPFVHRAERNVLFQHRPDQSRAPSTRELARFHDFEFLSCTYDSIPDVADYYLVAGAGIFSNAAIGKKKIINCHPGIIPSARGLDSFKWAILGQIPLGVTLHYIDAEVDAGQTLEIVETPLFPDDDLEVLARRHYELELEVLCEFMSILNKPNRAISHYPSNPARRRMPIDLEREMIAQFPCYKERFAANSVRV
ncbi:formyltransferase family protein [Bradyrhizobium canariense]|uniref:formyltransferase family protein n=1 Tax=Bradyrhizobium canariense TaxID=255045 RepID=UPI000A190925|nr:formyltransferase family protein [Bradyrhizobium canariense]OSI28338.1 hypothetical protein BST65_09575 [Bradyrhizobium canariense]OSI37357.1 hypothetical protein BST66_03340 [Bradyrhizobium canariense]OSI52466.1 hypothetical protein BSZ20_03815 [Bradyrhizobium canariense]OSI56486.1 hypothetical protein BST67_03305 [Bradyrhizobium canariense]OSI59511.1 hypothetical protein BSZ15_04460 [Bradyrhizobium canariense]